jgi:hypothetical protein
MDGTYIIHGRDEKCMQYYGKKTRKEDPIGNRPHDLPVCGTVPQPNVPPCTPYIYIYVILWVESGVLRLNFIRL